MTTDLHTILGASGGAGSALVAELVGRGRRVRAVSRHQIAGLPIGVAHIRADLLSAEGAAEAVAGSSVVYHAAQPALARWVQDFPRLTANVAAATRRTGAKLVVADNLYTYGPHDGALTEATPQRPPGPKAQMRHDMVEELLSENAAGDLRVAIGRASDYFGPGGVGSVLGESLFAHVLDGKPMRWLGPLDAPHTISYLPDVARALVVLGDAEAADGRVWHLPAGPPVTGTQFAALLGDALGRPVAAKTTGALGFWVASRFVPILRELEETRYQWQQPFVSDASAFDSAFGPFEPTPHPEALRTTVAWWKARAAGARDVD